MKLIGSLTSPYVRKVRVVLAEKKLDCPLVLEDVWSADTSIARSNPLGKVPCLVLEGGEALYDSRVIVEYLDTLSPVGRLIPVPGRERAQVKTWEALADGAMDAGVLARLEATWPGRAEGERSPAWVERQLGKARAALATMERGLQHGQPWLCGAHLSLADIAAGCAVAWLEFRLPEHAWRDGHPHLDALMQRLMQRPGFAETRPPQ
ncbi:glutathione S-transferase [Oryzisolibacter propanilivorax]|uniref:Glutathione S-transferase n=1 Tax=Oryzisolibacter propanilivorax TaxID=1527607 RepID=A0A1G9Q7C3_9BURK|nr:glutathione S-transferase C-terminal domain-containing protein [Oryzisolibacter propanilivorax]SDM06840.1 glutathione S-transferase [Oryzisolibacter propanilivorax]